MVLHLIKFFTKNTILFLGLFLIIEFKGLNSTAPQDDDNSESVMIVRNTLNPEKYFLIGDFLDGNGKTHEKEDQDRAFKEALSAVKTATKFPYLANQLFFYYDPRLTLENMPASYECRQMNPGGCWVYNSAFRITLFREDIKQDEQDYWVSRMLLSDYIAQQKVAVAMRKELQSSETIIFHPLKGIPLKTYTNLCTDAIHIPGYNFPQRWKRHHFNFTNEIAIGINSHPFNSIICRKFCTSSRNLRSILRLLR